MPSSPLSGEFFSHITAPRLLPLFLGICSGAFVSLGVILSGFSSVVAVRWLLWLPGHVLLQTFVGITLPLTTLHATFTGSHMQLSSRWLQLIGSTLAAYALAMLFASVLGALLVVTLQNTIPTLTKVWNIPPSGAVVTFGCPGEVSSGFVALQSDGTLACSSANTTAFVLDDVARTFVAASKTALDISGQAVVVAESLLPKNLVGAFVHGDVLSLVIGGLALGVALTGSFVKEKRQENEDDHRFYDNEVNQKQQLVMLQLVAQAEAVGCRMLSWMQAYMPISVALMISSVFLQPSALSSSGYSDGGTVVDTTLALMAVLLLALVLDVVVMILLATVFTRSNPFAFLEHLLPAQLLALSSGSSLVALPATVSAVVASKRVSPSLAFIVCSTSTVLNQTGTVLYLSVSTLFVLSASVTGIITDEVIASHSISSIAAMVFTNVLVASVVSPLPGGSKTVALATTLSVVFGVPTESRIILLVFLATLEWITGPCVACVNITNNALIALVIAHYFEAQPATKTETSSVGSGAVTHESLVLELRQQRVQDVVHENWV